MRETTNIATPTPVAIGAHRQTCGVSVNYLSFHEHLNIFMKPAGDLIWHTGQGLFPCSTLASQPGEKQSSMCPLQSRTRKCVNFLEIVLNDDDDDNNDETN